VRNEATIHSKVLDNVLCQIQVNKNELSEHGGQRTLLLRMELPWNKYHGLAEWPYAYINKAFDLVVLIQKGYPLVVAAVNHSFVMLVAAAINR
jgi:hypothetical protein